MPATIPIILTPLNVPGQTQTLNINDLLALICKYVGASISANVSFFLQGASWPVSDQGIYFNQTIGKFGTWNSGYGKYIPISDLEVGEIITTFVAGDDLPNGMVVLDGRNINAIAGLSQQQITNLETLFGVNQPIPSYSFFGSLQGIPALNSFSSIPVQPFAPTSAQVQSITFGSTYNQGIEQSLQADVALAAGSGTSLTQAVIQIQGIAEALLDALNNYTPTGLNPVQKIFVGFP